MKTTDGQEMSFDMFRRLCVTGTHLWECYELLSIGKEEENLGDLHMKGNCSLMTTSSLINFDRFEK